MAFPWPPSYCCHPALYCDAPLSPGIYLVSMLQSIVFALMDTLDVCPGGLTTFWLELSQAWRSPCTRAKALCSSDGMGGTSSSATGHRANNLRTAGWRCSRTHRFIDFLLRWRKKSDSNIVLTTGVIEIL